MTLKKLENDLTLFCGTVNIKEPERVLKKLSLVKTKPNGFVCTFSLEKVWSKNQVLFAAEHTRLAFKRNTSFSKNREHEFLIRLSGQKQASEAIEHFGIKSGIKQLIGIMAVDLKTDSEKKKLKSILKELNVVEQRNCFSKNNSQKKELLQWFGIPDKSIETMTDYSKEKAIERLIFEKIALIELEH